MGEGWSHENPETYGQKTNGTGETQHHKPQKNDNDEGKLLPAASRVGAGDLISLLSKAAGKGSLAGSFFFFLNQKHAALLEPCYLIYDFSKFRRVS